MVENSGRSISTNFHSLLTITHPVNILPPKSGLSRALKIISTETARELLGRTYMVIVRIKIANERVEILLGMLRTMEDVLNEYTEKGFSKLPKTVGIVGNCAFVQLS